VDDRGDNQPMGAAQAAEPAERAMAAANRRGGILIAFRDRFGLGT
jgi:hypothetical protein